MADELSLKIERKPMHLLLLPAFASAIWIGGGGVGLLLVIVVIVLLVR
jgi:cellobiose-specific phosphotransferase system component IIC